MTVDATELTGASAEPLKAIISRYGRPISARAFADFQNPNLAELAVQLYQLGFTLVHCPTWPNGDGFPKPVVTDILAQDLRDQLEELEGVDTFLVVVNSREYIAVANAVRRHDKRVVIVAEETKVARELRLCADEFAALPPTKAERSTAARVTRTATRPVLRRQERAPEPVRVERPVEHTVEPARVELPRPERAPEPVKVERQPEPVRETAKAEPSDGLRLPTDTEVVAEVRRIITAEGICTPRRLARALCPVDRTPTGELRSRIANRIQMLVDSGTLVREKLVVGGTSVETIVVGEDRSAHVAEPGAGEPAEAAVSEEPQTAFGERATEDRIEAVGSNGNAHELREPGVDLLELPSPVVETPAREPVRDLDAFVESVLRSPERPSRTRSRKQPPKAPKELVEPEPEPVAQEAAPKRSRSRRRSPARKGQAEGAVTEQESGS